MTGPSLDLDALREKAEAIIAAEGQFMSGYEARRIELAFQNAWTPERCLAVLALVEEQWDRISTLEEIERHARFLVEDPDADKSWLPWCDDEDCANEACIAARGLRDALAGSPAEKEQTDA